MGRGSGDAEDRLEDVSRGLALRSQQSGLDPDDLAPGLEFAIDTNFYWRLQTSDGIYSPSGAILRTGDTTNSRFVGVMLSTGLDWQIDRYIFVGLVYTHAFPRPFVRNLGSSDAIDFVELTFDLLF